MSNKKKEAGQEPGTRKEIVDVKTVHYGTMPLVECMKAVMKIHINKRTQDT